MYNTTKNKIRESRYHHMNVFDITIYISPILLPLSLYLGYPITSIFLMALVALSGIIRSPL